MEFIQLQLIEKGGVVMMLIVLLSVIAAVIVIERLLYFRSRRADEQKLLQRLTATLRKGHYEEALAICEDHPSALASLMQVGINHRHSPTTELREVILDAANMEIPKEERFLSALGTIANIAPLLGLLGTVTGNIQAFGVLSGMGSVGDAALLSRGISEALLTTAAGIIVSIPAIIFYNFLVSKVSHRMIRLEHRVSELIAMLVAAEQAAAEAGHPVGGEAEAAPAQPAAAGAQPGPAPQQQAPAAPQAPQQQAPAAPQQPAVPQPAPAPQHAPPAPQPAPAPQAPQPGVAVPQPGYAAPHPGFAAPQPAAPHPGMAPHPGVTPHPGVVPQPGYAAAAPNPGVAVAQAAAPQPGVALAHPAGVAAGGNGAAPARAAAAR